MTITTLSRNRSAAHNNNNNNSNINFGKEGNMTLSRNGGVFITVGDWCNNTQSLASNANTNKNTLMPDESKESYYEVLKQDNNSTAYENVSTVLHTECDPTQNNAIYAVVNKVNKTKSKQHHITSYTPVIEPTRYTYIGMNPSVNTKNAKYMDTFDMKKTNRNNVLNTNLLISLNNVNDNNNANLFKDQRNKTVVSQKNGADSQITINTVDNPGNGTSEIYAKVWKVPRNPLETQKRCVFKTFVLKS